MPKYKDVNEFAKELTKAEGGKKQVDIAQIKEILSKIKGMLAPELDLYNFIKTGKLPVTIKETKVEVPRAVDNKQAIKDAVSIFKASRQGTQDGVALASMINHLLED